MRAVARIALVGVVVAVLLVGTGTVGAAWAAPAVANAAAGDPTNGDVNANPSGNGNEKDPCKKKDTPCTDIPEAPVALLYGGVGFVAIGGFFLLNRRRRSGTQITA
jgi:hypothetical protein